ncbi:MULTISPECIES: ABC transporter ATP-binding protein [Oceanobacillus]|uniref:ABC transporter ATP-binding protein n=1 Tax=Oceanobacillus TaxID=182709 RepID=UPI000349C773|nr:MULTISPECIES: ABC transporter ATP-binding protein [Oceanobacillus]MBT2601375.1 ABC transporter ATP-binding protein [Oceanobacillus sp. ISL-74]MBT2653459.1 ABC transporter ATP-binding protein [Oceanobacillus sp. ISL-73]MCT1578865.1 ABC transporter ATP-binding protein [Oceanobacillus kimchii]MCT2137685.1 ABC transporter ATP-binding protein [Oceanobacillus kimchii]OEH53240.1 ABC transporter ATP-binding protein [Oceanobacillus sp. E9]
MNLLTVNQLTKSYKGKTVVNHIDFKVPDNACVALIGPNGAGKTTTLKMLAGLLQPSSGEIIFHNRPIKGDFRNYIGYLPQYPTFYSWMTGYEFLVYCAKLCLLSPTAAKSRAKELLQKTGIYEAKDKRISSYSGGMKQRLGIAQAIIHQPKLLLLDEPVSSLDPIGRREILLLMEELKKDMSIFFSTHILRDAEEVSDELILLHQGKVIESGSISNLQDTYQTSMIRLEFQDSLEIYQEKVNKLSNVSDTYIEKNTLWVTAIDIPSAREEILLEAATHNWDLTNFSIDRASLEDMFMKAVNR